MGRKKIKRIEFERLEADEILRKRVKAMGARSGGVYLPGGWVGREVVITLPRRDKDLQFIEYTLGQAMMLLEEAEKSDDINENPLLLDSIYTTSVILSNLEDDYVIPEELQVEIRETVKKLDDVLKPTGYLENGDDL